MEETQDGWNIGFVNIRIRLRLRIRVFENITVGFKNTRLPVTLRKDVAIPQVLHSIHHRRVLENKEDEFVILPPVEPVKLAFLHDLAFFHEDAVFVVTAL